MKPFQIIVLAVFGVLALVGLVFFATSKGVGGGEEVGAVSIWGLLPQDAVETTITEIGVSDKRFGEVTYREMRPETFGADLAEAIAEGGGPDLVIITQEELLSEGGKLSILPFDVIPERTFIDTYVPMAELFLTPQGIYGIPLTIDPLVLFYNQSALSNAGVASAPTTWEAVSSLAQTMTVATEAGAISKSVIPFGDYTNVRNARAILSTLFFQAGIAISEFKNDRVAASLTGSNEAGGTSAEAAVGFYTQFSNPAKTVYTWNRVLSNSRDAFLASTLVLYPGFASERIFLESANPNLEFDMAPIPQPATAESRSTYGLLYAAAIPRAAANPNGALQVATVLAGAAEASYLAGASGMAPAQNASLTANVADRYAPVYYPEALRARGWLSPSSFVTDGIFAGMIGNVTSGRRSIIESLESANDSLDAALP